MAKRTMQRKTRGTKAPEGEFEVVEEVTVETTAKPPMGVEAIAILVTFVALVTAFVLINIEMRGAFGKGWPF